MCEVRGASLTLLTRPFRAGTATVSVVLNIVTTTRHMVDNCISVNTHTMGTTSCDQTAECITVTTSAIQVVRNWLIVEIPWIQLSVLRPFIRNHGFLSGEDFNSHPAHFAKCFTLSFDISVWPAKHLDNSTLLTIVVCCILNNGWILPKEIRGFRLVSELCTRSISSLHDQGESICKRTVNWEDAAGSETFIVPVVLHFGDAAVLAASSFDLSGISATAINNIVVADNTAHTLVTFLPVGRSGKWCLETAVNPVWWVSGLGATGTLKSLEVGAIVSWDDGDKECRKETWLIHEIYLIMITQPDVGNTLLGPRSKVI